MTTLKSNLHILNRNKNNDSQKKTHFAFDKLLSNTQKLNLTQDHKSLIEEIKSKNSLLVKVQKDKNYLSAKNLPTYCQKYASILYKKYGPTTQNKVQLLKSKEISVKFVSEEQQLQRNIFIARQYLHVSQQDFQQSLGQLSIRLKQISNYVSSKCRGLRGNDKQIEEQLAIMESICSKFTNRIISNHITPFFYLNKDIKSQTPVRTQLQTKIRKEGKVESYNCSIMDKKGIDCKLINDNSPNLLSGFEQRQNDQQHLLMSFKPNMETSQNCFSTLKYSQSQFRLQFSKNQQKQNSKHGDKQDENDSLPFSPVQPYRLHKLETETQNEKINTIGDKLQSLLKNDEFYIKSFTEQISISIKKGTKKQYAITGSMMSFYSQSVDEFSKTIQKTHSLISNQNILMQDEWNQISLFLHKDIQQMFDLLQLQKTQNQIKDKKFLQNLDMIQNQLIEEIFAQKQFRKADQQVLTQLLTNLIDSFPTDQKL